MNKDFYVGEVVYLEGIMLNGQEVNIDDDVEIVAIQENTCTVKGTANRLTIDEMFENTCDEMFEYTFVVPKKNLSKYE